MVGKRKSGPGTENAAKSSRPCKRCRSGKARNHSNTHERKRTDPFRYLNFDCASLILEYLDPVSVVRCGMVDKGWAAFIRVWICALGLRVHFPLAWNLDIKKDEPKATEIYKNEAAPFATLPTGQASAVRKIGASMEVIAFAGDLVAWNTGPDLAVHWQDLGIREDGSFNTPQKFTPPFRDDEGVFAFDKMRLNANGQVLVRAMQYNDVDRDFLIDLKTQEIKWRRDNNTFPRQTPVLVGEERVYYVVADAMHIEAVDIKSGQQLYRVPTPGTSPPPTHPLSGTRIWGWGDTELSRRLCVLVQLDGREVIAGIADKTGESWGRTVLVMDGATGQWIQETRVPTTERLEIVVSPDRTQFAVIGETSCHKALVFQYFEPAPDGRSFLVSGTQLLEDRQVMFGPTAKRGAIDPFRSIVALLDSEFTPRVARLTPKEKPVSAAMLKVQDTYSVSMDRVLVKGRRREITVPAATHGEPRRWFEPDRRPFEARDLLAVHFVDGHRVVVEASRWVERPGWSQAVTHRDLVTEYYIFDFRLRPGGGYMEDGLQGERRMSGESLLSSPG
ncbi:uncharacterized protein DSM5745_00094 [Aspergillus mulundensis]|uniref:F-box domain-containing protein n=1 Tax=Aspergillus mulundensis TaxID=1810919 RepID=A0A3D8T2I6_9EURO|nr:hypothetical protein DSM5745_00094 [Aspergillus mulundensis]RDW92772.1 hypothetical protein DSM5745_00094 [Aspergillus mulundensis]